MKNSDNMSRILCKGAKEDGSPCQPNGLSQFDGCCIAHDPADKTLQQRSRGGNTAAVSAQQNKYGIESLIVQGLATLRQNQTQDAAEPALTDVGRRRPGLQRLTSYTPEGIDRTKDLLSCPSIHRHRWTAALSALSTMRASIEEALEDLARDLAPARDALTSHILSELPAGVKTGPVPDPLPGKSKSTIKILESQREQVERLIRTFEVRFEDELEGHLLERTATGHA